MINLRALFDVNRPVPQNVLEQLEHNCNTRTHGWEYADNVLKMRRCEEQQRMQPMISISYGRVRHYPVRCRRRGS